MDAFRTEFFVSGGTMPADAESYVERVADRQLFDCLVAGTYCYVLNCRQLGKSSLCVRVKEALARQDIRTAFVDLTRIGGANLNAEQWYAGLAFELGNALNDSCSVDFSWTLTHGLPPMQRFFHYLRDAVDADPRPLVVFVDEIDSARSLLFDTDEFFAGIRECYNSRVFHPALRRLTFALIGVAVPNQLMRNPAATPFNIAERIVLEDFTFGECSILSKGLDRRKHLINRIFWWTAGHPFITQSLCLAVKRDRSIVSNGDVDDLIRREFLTPRSKKTQVNLADVSNRVLNTLLDGGSDRNVQRAEVLSTYEAALRKRSSLLDDESNHVATALKLSGLMKATGKWLVVRNRIYRKAFDRRWIKENMPDHEQRRQHGAFVRGVTRASVIASALLLFFAALVWNNYRLFELAQRQKQAADHDAYVAEMNLVPSLWRLNDQQGVQRTLAQAGLFPGRGPEWGFWQNLASGERSDIHSFAYSQDGSFLLSSSTNWVTITDLRHGSVKSFATQFRLAGPPVMARYNGFFLEGSAGRPEVYRIDATTGRSEQAYQGVYLTCLPNAISSNDWQAVGLNDKQRPVILSLDSGKSKVIDRGSPCGWPQFMPGSKLISWIYFEPYNIPAVHLARIEMYDPDTQRIVSTTELRERPVSFQLSPSGDGMADIDDHGNFHYMVIPRLSTRVTGFAINGNKFVAMQFSPDGHSVLVKTIDGGGSVYDTRPQYLARRIHDYASCGGKVLQNDGSLKEIDFATDRRPTVRHGLLELSLPDRLNTQVAVFERSHVVAGLTNGKVQWLNYQRPSQTSSYQVDRATATVGFGKYHPWVMQLSLDKKLRIHDLLSEKNYGPFLTVTPVIVACCESPDGRLIALCWHQHLNIYDVDTGELRYAADIGDDITRIDISPSGALIALGCSSGEVWLGNVGRPLRRLLACHASISALRFSLNDDMLAAGSLDKSAVVVNVSAGNVSVRLLGHLGAIRDVAFIDGSNRVITSADDGTMRIWEATTGTQVTCLEPGRYAQTIRANLHEIVTASGESTVRIWTNS